MIEKQLSGLNEAAKIIHQGNVDRGFWDKEHDTGTYLMLMTSELAEALEAHRKSRFCNLKDDLRKDLDDWKNNPEWSKATFNSFVKDSIQDELADCIIRVLDYCAAKDIDIEWHINQKIQYNNTRPRLHGKNY